MAGKSPYEAVLNYIAPLQRVASCVTSAVLRYQGRYQPETSYALALGDGTPIRLTRINRTGPPLYLSFTMWYRIVEAAGVRGPWKVTIDGYEYSLDDDQGHEAIAYHWHPGRGWANFPHVHLGAGAQVGRRELIGLHLPTERIAFEDVVWLAIHELGVRPLRLDWEGVLSASRTLFQRYRTWPDPD